MYFQSFLHPASKDSTRKMALSGFLCVLVISGFGQLSATEKGKNEALAHMDSLRRSIDTTLNHRTLDGLLAKKFPETSWVDGRWVYYKDQANIQQLVKPRVSAVIPEYSFYTVTLTNYLGYHINHSRKLILFDSAKSRVIHVVPMWHGDISADLLRLFIGKTFPDSTSLLNFTLELHSLMNAGSTGGFENTTWHEDKVTFDLTYQGSNRKEVWRHIEMFIEDNKIKRFRSTNPKMNQWVTVE